MLFAFIKWWSYKNKETRNHNRQKVLKETIDSLVEQLLDDPEIERRNRILIEHGKIAPTKEEERFMKALEAFKSEQQEQQQQDGDEKKNEKTKKKGNVISRAFSWMFGDYSPENNIALVCGKCMFHNGFVPPKEFFADGFSFVCFCCHKLNRRAASRHSSQQQQQPPTEPTQSSSSSSSSSSVTTPYTETSQAGESYLIDGGVVREDNSKDDKKVETVTETESKKDK